MPPPRPPQDVLERVVEAYKASGNKAAVARDLGLPVSTAKQWLTYAAEAGMLGTDAVLPGFRLTRTTEVHDESGTIVRRFVSQARDAGEPFEVPPGHAVKGVSALVDADGRTVQQWIKTKEGVLDPLQVAEWLKEAFTDLPARDPVAAPSSPSSELLTLTALPDLHVGMRAWSPQTDGPNWDLAIAEREIGAAIEDVILRSPSSATGIILGGGDLIHVDTAENKTAAGTPQDADDRFQKIVEVACGLVERAVDAARRRHEQVIVRILPGNHDTHSHLCVTFFLLALYRNEPRVLIDRSPSLYFWHRHGRVLIGATHGHTIKPGQMPGIMAHRRAEDWGATRYRYAHTFHRHHAAKSMTEGEGVVTEVHQAPIPPDAWTAGSGYLSGRSLQSISYHCQFGEIGRVRTAILDGAGS